MRLKILPQISIQGLLGTKSGFIVISVKIWNHKPRMEHGACTLQHFQRGKEDGIKLLINRYFLNIYSALEQEITFIFHLLKPLGVMSIILILHMEKPE